MVCRLFTSILKKACDLTVKLTFNDNLNIKITKKNLAKLFEFVTSGTHILFDENYYGGIDGVAMRSSLGPVVANLFKGFHEKQWLKEFNVNDKNLFSCEVDAIRLVEIFFRNRFLLCMRPVTVSY